MPLPIHEPLGHNPPGGTVALSDEEIVRRVVEGETELFELLMRRHNQRLYRLAFSLVGEASEAEDVLQDSYVRAFNGLPHFAGRSSLGSWLAAIVRNVAIDYLRLRRARQGAYTLEADLAAYTNQL